MSVVVDSLLSVARIVGFCNCTVFCYASLCRVSILVSQSS